MKKLLGYNKAMFKAGGWFTKFFMVSLPIFVLCAIFLPITGDVSLINQEGAGKFVMIVFYSGFALFYPIRNYLMVNKVVKGAEVDPEIKDKYRALLAEVEKLEL